MRERTTQATVEPLLWRRSEVEQATGLSTSSIYKAVQAGGFPRPRRVPGTPGIVVWRVDEVLNWIEGLPTADPRDRPAQGRAARVA